MGALGGAVGEELAAVGVEADGEGGQAADDEVDLGAEAGLRRIFGSGLAGSAAQEQQGHDLALELLRVSVLPAIEPAKGFHHG